MSEDYKKDFQEYWKRNLENLERMRQQQRIDAENEERLRIEALNQPVVPDEVPIAGLQILNGRVVNKPAPQPSQAVIKTAQLTAMNQAALKK